jgi:hypothetical protein
MASSSTASAAASPFSSGVTEKLGKNNFVVWQAQVLPAVRGARLEGSCKAPAEEIAVKTGDTIAKQENPEHGV